jgi:hypothetical protein
MLLIFSVLYGIMFCSLQVMHENDFEKRSEYLNPKKRQKIIENIGSLLPKTKTVYPPPYCQISMYPYAMTSSFIVTISLTATEYLTISDPMSDLVRHYDFPVPDAFLDL